MNPDQPTESDSPAASNADQPPQREVRYEYSPHFPRILEHLGASLLVSTYQAGKLGVIGTHEGKLTFSFLNYIKAMGVAVAHRRLAVGSLREIHFLHAAPELAPSIEPAGRHDACWLTRESHHTGNIHIHELAWGSDGLWVVNTLFSCLCTLHDEYSFVPRWRPPFVSELIAQDRCHLNGVAMHDGRPRYVTAHGVSNDPAGWRPDKASGGVLIDVDSGETVSHGLAMPHSPRLFGDRLWVLNSGAGTIDVVDPANGQRDTVERVPGFTRGLDFHGQFAFVGLSKIRETSVFGGVPIAEQRDELRAGVGVIDLVSGKAVAALQFHSGVDEIFSVNVLPGCLNPALRGPQPEEDGTQEIWLVPPEGQVPEATNSNRHTPCAVGGGAVGVAGGSLRSTPATHSLHDLDGTTRGAPASMVPGQAPPATGPAALFRAAMELSRQGHLPQALDQLKRASVLAPQRPDIHTELGNLYQQLNDQHTALACYRRAAEVDPQFVPARQNLGYLLLNHGEPEEALEHYEQALRQEPSPINRLLAATVLPVVYDSTDDVERWRQRLAGAVHQLADEGVTIDTTNTLVPTSFFLAYQGKNDVDIARDLGRIFRSTSGERPLASGGRQPTGELATDLHATTREPAGSRPPLARESTNSPLRHAKIKIAFLSAYFRDHTIGRLNIGRIEHLSRDDFEVTVISVGEHRDELAERFQQAADRYVVVPRHPAAAREQITQLGVDLLVFTDVGMDALTYTLAFSRMAPVQCATWGHPDTTGSPAIDYFLSSELLETSDADSHYSEKLVRLSNLGTYYERPVCSRSRESSGPNSRESGYEEARQSFGLDPQRHVYLCPQTLFKFHPEFDAVLAGILAGDPSGDLVLIEGRVPNWTLRLKRRFEKTLPGGTERVRFLPAQPNQEFLRLLELADVVIDPHHFGGGNTSYEALAMGTPVVTWPSPFLRGRITAALYQKMGMTDLIVDSAESYVDLAVRIGTNRELRSEMRDKILAKCGVLYEDLNEVRSLEDCLRSLRV